MNILTAGSVKLLGGTLVVLCALALAVSVTAAPGLIDFRNYIPGVLDAPVFRADGTNRLSGMAYWAQLYAGPDENSLVPWGAAVPFGTGEMAGYWDADDPIRAVGTVEPGDRVVVQVRTWDDSFNLVNYDNVPPPRLLGRSATFQLTITDTPTPLIGLNSFTLEAAPIREVYVQEDHVVLRWSAGNGTAHYDVETASALEIPLVWTRIEMQPSLIIIRPPQSAYWWADWILTNHVEAPSAYYRIRLLDP